MKKIFLLILMGTFVFSITGCSNGYLTEISYDEYKQLIEDKESFVLEVMKKDCSACKEFRPKLKEVAKEYKLEIKYIDYSKLNEEQQDDFGIESTPTIIFYRNGEEETTSTRLVGNQSKKKIIERLKSTSFIDE